jgi:hypothetical protein
MPAAGDHQGRFSDWGGLLKAVLGALDVARV